MDINRLAVDLSQKTTLGISVSSFGALNSVAVRVTTDKKMSKVLYAEMLDWSLPRELEFERMKSSHIKALHVLSVIQRLLNTADAHPLEVFSLNFLEGKSA